MNDTNERIIRIGHSPDPDDAFMFYALVRGLVKIPGCKIQHEMADIQTLNEKSENGDLEVTAVSARAYPRIAERYGILHCGASMGRSYGPAVISRAFVHPSKAMDNLKGLRIAVPGEMTTAFLLLNLALEDYTPVQAKFDDIIGMVEREEVDAGLIIHEGQITYREKGLFKLLDLGVWWAEFSQFPMPLGLNVIRRDLGDLVPLVSKGIRESIEYALSHEEEAVRYALQFGRGIDVDTGTRFVRMYVNEDSRDLKGDGIKGLKLLYEMAVNKGYLKEVPNLELF